MQTSKLTTPRHHERDRAERGSVTLQNVIAFPVVILFTFGILQAAFWMNAQNMAQAAAAAGYSAAKAYTANDTQGQAVANQIIASSSDLRGAGVQITRGPTSVTVTVSGTTNSPIPGWGGPGVRATVTGPTERWVAP
jgi:Flp pilus assembly protein TadG